MKSYKEMTENLKESELHEDDEKETSVVSKVARSDYKTTPSGRKTHKQIVFKGGTDGTKTVQEETLDEVSPPGFEGTVKAMKNKKEIDNPYALAWSMYKKGFKSHKNPDGTVKEEFELDEAAGHTIEAHGIKGMKGTPWRKTFKSHDHLNDWAEKNDSVQVHGTRDLEGAKKKTNEEFELNEDVYAKSEENKRSADAAKKQGNMFDHHLHMADHHDNLAQWHSQKGRHGEADKHAEKSEKHQELAMKHKGGGIKEETVVMEATKHRVAVTVSEPDHPAVSMRNAQKQKFIKVSATNRDDAVKRAHAYYKKAGYKVHSANYHSEIKEEAQLDEAINAGDYTVTSEKSSMTGGHRPKVVHKTKGTTMHLSSHSYKSPEHAKAHAKAYLDAYSRLGMHAAERAGHDFASKNKDKRIVKEESELVELTVPVNTYKHRDERGRYAKPKYYGQTSKDAIHGGGVFAKSKPKSVKEETKPETKQDDPPFDADKKPVTRVRPGKQGIGPSTARHLAQMAMRKQMKKEEVEQIDEISSELAGKVSDARFKKVMADPKNQSARDKFKRASGSAIKRITRDMIKDPEKANRGFASDADDNRKRGWSNESVEHIDELKISTLTRYGTKATQSLGRDPSKTEKRIDGINRARAKVQQQASMKKEEVELDESHFKLGDTVKCKESGMTGKVTVLDKPHGEGDDKYYTVKRSDGKEMKYAPNELELVKEDLDESKSLKDIAAAAERRAGSVMKPKAAPTQSSTKTSLSGIRAAAERRKMKEDFELDEVDTNILSYKDFMSSLLEYEAKDGVYRHKGSYGSSYQGDDDDEKKPSQPTEKRGRGRPAGAKSGARGPRSK